MDATTPPRSPWPDGSPAAEAFAWMLPRHNAGWFLLRGLLAIAFGLIALFLPGTAVLAAAMVFAAFTFADGVLSLISGLRGAAHHRERWGWMVFNGVIGIAVGALFVVWPLMSTMAYAFALLLFMAAFYLATGVGQLAAAIRLRKQIEGEWVLALLGISAILFGAALVFILLSDPAVTLLAVAWMIGFYALLSGAFLIVLWNRLRKA